MTQNDEQIKNLLSIIENKKSVIGEKPTGVRKSNGILNIGNGHQNINTIGSVEACVIAVARVLQEQGCMKEASKFLGVEFNDPSSDAYLEDLKLRASIIKWDLEKKKLDILEKQLKDLRSEHLVTADALSDITKLLSV